ncbi:MAG: HAD family hydrolase [Promethearchaeota archaeon]
MIHGQRIKAVIFDLDGTLIQSQIDFKTMREQINLVLGRFSILDKIRPNAYILERIEFAVRKLGADSPVIGELWSIVDKFEEQGMQEAYIEEEVPNTLKELSNTRKLGVVTNNSESITNEVLVRFNIEKFFSIIVCRAKDRRPKPHPDNILYSISKLRFKPENTLYIGDNILDSTAARNANVYFIGYRLFHSDFPKIDAFNQIHDEIEKLENKFMGK